jgi:hypothetical protein
MCVRQESGILFHNSHVARRLKRRADRPNDSLAATPGVKFGRHLCLIAAGLFQSRAKVALVGAVAWSST